MAVTIKDVAREAGVSISTVSKVVNKSSYISEATAARVNDVIKKLDYAPNNRARSFKRRATKNIVFLAYLRKDEAFTSPHVFEILCGINNSLKQKGYTITLMDVSDDEKLGASAKTVISNQSYDGMIVHGSAINSSVASLMVRSNFPHIVIAKPEFESQVCWLDTNNVLAGDIAARHLADCGANRLAFIAGTQNDGLNFDRITGVKTAAKKLGLELNSSHIQYTDSSVEGSCKAVSKLLYAQNRPDAIVCANNLIAIGTLKAIKKAGLSIPDEIQLITVDDYPYSRIMDPMPTVVNINVYELGIQAGSMLLYKIKNPALQIQSYTTLPELIIRGTTGKRRAT